MARRWLSAGLERVLPDHRSSFGKRLQAEYRALLTAFAIDGDKMLQREAGRAAWLRVRSVESQRAWAELAEKRATGRGRRPSARHVERAARRAALDDASALSAYDRVRELAGARRQPTLAEAIAQASGKQA